MKKERFSRWLALFFAVSGFCGLGYEIVWIRLAMARFGVNTVMISIVVSLFMAGLGLGSWLAGLWTKRRRASGAAYDLKAYAVSELMIGFGGLIAPILLEFGHEFLGRADVAWGSSDFYLASMAVIAVAIVPWCVFMGATIPLAMSAIEKAFPERAGRSFSFLYVANVLGASAGALLAAFVLIELLGLHGTGRLMAAFNAALAAGAWWLSSRLPDAARAAKAQVKSPTGAFVEYWLLFATGFTGMAIEIVWTRQLIPYLGLHVYAFASILVVYLVAYNLGSTAYRRAAAAGFPIDVSLVWAATALCGATAMIAADPRLPVGFELGGAIVRLYIAVGPLSFAMGFLTPMLVDRFCRGNAELAGKGYAANVLGCIAGPLAASFALLPYVSERWAEAMLLLSFCAAGLARSRPVPTLACGLAVALAAFVTADYESRFGRPIVLRDSSATVIAFGEGKQRKLFINGSDVTAAVPATKFMAHLPLAFLDHPPIDALVICFGMGTTFRSLLSWGLRATAVELAPSVPTLFPYFHKDGAELMSLPRARIVIDDGRRFLQRSREQFDVITIDPAPPIEGMGNSLLYSREFYALAKQRLRSGGILQQWYWREADDPYLLASALIAVRLNFEYVRVFPDALSSHSIGFHILASDHPIVDRSPKELASRLPAAARKDFLEWGPETQDSVKQFARLLSAQDSADDLLKKLPSAPPLSDDRPQNEYHLLRDFSRVKDLSKS